MTALHLSRLSRRLLSDPRRILRDGRGRASARETIERRFGIDPRALGAFRILFGLVVLFDVLHRSRNLRTFYTDDGVYPRDLRLEESAWTAEYSLHLLSGAAWFQALLFALTGLAAIALIVGYRPRLAALAAAVLVVSLHWRNPLVLNGADRLLRDLLLFAIFLPLAGRWAIRGGGSRAGDSRGDGDHGDGDRGDGDRRQRVATPATAAILLYVVTIFFSNALDKRAGETWPSGEALAYALRQDQMTILLGNHLVDYPLVLELATYGWYGLLLCSPLLLVTVDWGRIACVVAFLSVFVGMALTVAVGLFPPLLATAICLFLPPRAWDALERVGGAVRSRCAAGVAWSRRRIGLGHATSAFSRPGWLRVPDFLGRPRVPTVDGWLRVPAPVRRLRVPALGLVPRTLSAPQHHRYRRWARTGWSVLLGGVLVFTVLWGVGILGWADPFEPVDTLNPENNGWGMYAEDPSDRADWHVVTAHLENGERHDVLLESPARSGPPPDASETFPSFRWRLYFIDLHGEDAADRREAFTAYACERADAAVDEPVERIDVDWGYQAIDLEEETEPRRFDLATRSCDDSGAS